MSVITGSADEQKLFYIYRARKEYRSDMATKMGSIMEPTWYQWRSVSSVRPRSFIILAWMRASLEKGGGRRKSVDIVRIENIDPRCAYSECSIRRKKIESIVRRKGADCSAAVHTKMNKSAVHVHA